MTAPAKLTAAQRKALAFLDPLMGASAAEIGRALSAAGIRGSGSNLIAIGASTAAHLKRKGYAARVGCLGLWRITDAGRAALRAEAEGGEDG